MKRQSQSSLLDFAVRTKKYPASTSARSPQPKDCHSSDSDDVCIIDQSHNISSDTSVMSSIDISGQQSSSDSVHVPTLIDTTEKSKSVASASTTEQAPSDIAPNAGHSPC